ncbi:hypothetical protein [Succinatimonas hippei]|uniref:hypothetical protein n=1 Tax=Succinatimonas hippei TaxID=626938 RepID=UPI00255C42D1|nr:hypothetical protein [Succinatimonas hippei]
MSLNDKLEPILDTDIYNRIIEYVGICLTVSDNTRYADVAYCVYVRCKCINILSPYLKSICSLNTPWLIRIFVVR